MRRRRVVLRAETSERGIARLRRFRKSPKQDFELLKILTKNKTFTETTAHDHGTKRRTALPSTVPRAPAIPPYGT